MDFFIGNPFATPVGQRIEHATSSSLQSEDWSLNMEICDIINETEEGPKDAVRAIKKRIVGNKNFKEVMLALTVLEACVKNCGHRFHVLVSTREFVEGVLVRAIWPKNNPPMVLHDRVLSLIQAWADAFRSSPSLTGVVSVYEELRRQGLEFPTADRDSLSPIHTPHRSFPDDGSLTSMPAAARHALPPSASPQHSVTQPGTEEPLSISPDQVQKLRGELQVARENLTLMSEMMNQLDPDQAHASDTELLQQLYVECKATQDRVVQLIPVVSEEGLMEELLTANDELNSAFTHYSRFDKLLTGKLQASDTAYANLVDLDTASHTFNESEIAPAPGHQPVSQSTVSTLSNQMAGLCARDDGSFTIPSQRRSNSQSGQRHSECCEDTEDAEEPAEALGPRLQNSGAKPTRKQRLEKKICGDDNLESTGLSSSPNFDWMVAKGMIPVSQMNAMDDIEKWLDDDGEERMTESEGVTSEEFDKFLEERAKAGDRLPNLRATTSDQAHSQSHDQSFML